MIKFYLTIILSGLLLILCLGCASNSEAVILYSGKLYLNLDDKSVIAGRIVDKSTNEPITNANVIIDSIYIGSATDFNGNYKLTNIPSGIYNIKVNCLGFNEVRFLNIKIDKGYRYLIDFFLQEKPLILY